MHTAACIKNQHVLLHSVMTIKHKTNPETWNPSPETNLWRFARFWTCSSNSPRFWLCMLIMAQQPTWDAHSSLQQQSAWVPALTELNPTENNCWNMKYITSKQLMKICAFFDYVRDTPQNLTTDAQTKVQKICACFPEPPDKQKNKKKVIKTYPDAQKPQCQKW